MGSIAKREERGSTIDAPTWTAGRAPPPGGYVCLDAQRHQLGTMRTSSSLTASSAALLDACRRLQGDVGVI